MANTITLNYDRKALASVINYDRKCDATIWNINLTREKLKAVRAFFSTLRKGNFAIQLASP